MVATTDACRAFWQVTQPAGTAEPVEQAAPRRRPRPGRSTGGSGDVASADAEVSAATDLWIGDHGHAAERAREAADLLSSAGETEHAAFWRYVQAHALFERGRDEDLGAARTALEAPPPMGLAPRGSAGWTVRLPTSRDTNGPLMTPTASSSCGMNGVVKPEA
ncbi:hypothetical protein ACFWQL_26605 [Amycolatopsis thermoflava]|uniref:hypothetical protein n=1 Tax=Amycolatopsis thermoflava TaxID=84480 RepID=UPI00364ECA33